MLRLIEIAPVVGWSVFVIISSGAAAETAKDKLGRAYPSVIKAGIIFSFISGVALLIFILERVVGFGELDIRADPWLVLAGVAGVAFVWNQMESRGAKDTDVGTPDARREDWFDLRSGIAKIGPFALSKWLVEDVLPPLNGNPASLLELLLVLFIVFMFTVAAFGVLQILISWEFPRLCRGGSRSLTFRAVAHRGDFQT